MKSYLTIISLLFFFACGNEGDSTQTSELDKDGKQEQTKKETKAPKSDCKYGAPVAIFSEKLEQVKSQAFESTGQKGVETVEFADGKLLELFQSGCNEIRQEYRFTIKGEFKDKPDDFWFKEAIDHLTYIGQIDERYAVIGMWVGALDHMQEDMKIGEFSEAEQSTFIMVDKIVESGASMVIVVLERRV